MATTQLKLGGIEQMIVGMTEEQARRTLKINGFEYCVVERDGKNINEAVDAKSDRFDLIVVAGKVVKAIRV